MDHKELLLAEWDQELKSTRKILQNVPENFDWKPHEKSMSLGRLATHVAEIPSWMTVTLSTDTLDFADGYTPNICKNKEELLALFDKSAAESTIELKNLTDETMKQHWTMRNGEQIYFPCQKQLLCGHGFSTTWSTTGHNWAFIYVC
jgi:uncharacterized damage-inducible protein DinB